MSLYKELFDDYWSIVIDAINDLDEELSNLSDERIEKVEKLEGRIRQLEDQIEMQTALRRDIAKNERYIAELEDDRRTGKEGYEPGEIDRLITETREEIAADQAMLKDEAALRASVEKAQGRLVTAQERLDDLMAVRNYETRELHAALKDRDYDRADAWFASYTDLLDEAKVSDEYVSMLDAIEEAIALVQSLANVEEPDEDIDASVIPFVLDEMRRLGMLDARRLRDAELTPVEALDCFWMWLDEALASEGGQAMVPLHALTKEPLPLVAVTDRYMLGMLNRTSPLQHPSHRAVWCDQKPLAILAINAS